MFCVFLHQSFSVSHYFLGTHFIPPKIPDGWNSNFYNYFPRFSGCDLASEGFSTEIHQSVFLSIFWKLESCTPHTFFSLSLSVTLRKKLPMATVSALQQLGDYGSDSSDSKDVRVVPKHNDPHILSTGVSGEDTSPLLVSGSSPTAKKCHFLPSRGLRYAQYPCQCCQ